MVVRFEDEAREEYREGGLWYEARVTGLGVGFFDEVDAALRHILAFPGAGSRVPRMPQDLPVRRLAVKRFPYHVIYLNTAEGLRVIAVAHDRRRPGYWRDRLSST